MKIAEATFGPDVGGLKGKTTRRKPPQIDIHHNQLADIFQPYRNVTIGVDIMYVNRMPLLVSISKSLRFGTIAAFSSQCCGALMQGIQRKIASTNKGVSTFKMQ